MRLISGSSHAPFFGDAFRCSPFKHPRLRKTLETRTCLFSASPPPPLSPLVSLPAVAGMGGSEAIKQAQSRQQTVSLPFCAFLFPPRLFIL